MAVPHDLDRLLKHIVAHYTGPEEAKDVERDASSSSVTQIAGSRERALREEEQRADALASAFRDGLQRAHAAYRAGGDAISLDDRDPKQNRMADALVHFLVGPGIATSKSRETAPLHYIYTISVDWARLEQIAREAHVDLHQALTQQT
jgi:hypothetical protein